MKSNMSSQLTVTGCVALVIMLAACGGGSSSGSTNTNTNGGGGSTVISPTQSDFAQRIFRSSTFYKGACLNPRTGSRDAQGSTEDENNWLRSWSNDVYLWYDEITDVDPDLHTTPAYFDFMRTNERTTSDARKDRFHFTYDTQEWQQLSRSGTSVGYGADIIFLANTPPRRTVISIVQPGSPAAKAGVDRGTVIVRVDGEDLVNGNNGRVLHAGLFPATAGESHVFLIKDFDGSNERSITLVSADITEETVPVTQTFTTDAGTVVGYMVFSSFLEPSEKRLVAEFRTMVAANVTEFILDLRYNGGGYLDIANELAFMIAGPAAAQGKVFDEIQFNDKHRSTNPITGQALSPDIFHATTQGFSLTAGDPLPSLTLDRVFILVGARTASASESIINGLRGIDFPVVLIGERTTGKPHGFYPIDNCGTTYFSIQFQSMNAAGFGEFADGFVPTQKPKEKYEVQGCVVQDDFARALGNVDEARLKTALGYVDANDCSAAPVGIAQAQAQSLTLGAGVGALKSPMRIPGAIKRP